MTETPFGEIKSAPDAESIFETPDHTKSRTVPPGVKRAFGKLGANKKTRSGVRALKPEDIARLEEYYDLLAFAVGMYKPAVAEAIRDDVTTSYETAEGLVTQTTTRAALCAQAWGELAKENDSVRRMILMMVETGAWSKVFMANLPILVAALPDDALSRLMSRFMPMQTDDTLFDSQGDAAA